MEKTNTGILSSDILRRQSYLVQCLWITGFAALTAVGAQIEIPHLPVPYTLQTLFVLLSGALLGKRNGALSQVLYVMAGLSGFPVFSGFGFGIARLIGPTGGYLLSFPVAAFVVGYLLEKNSHILWAVVTMMVGLFIVFSLGTLQLQFVYYHNWFDAINNGFLIFSWWDVLKMSTAVGVYHLFRGQAFFTSK